MLSYVEQIAYFQDLRNSIEVELRATGFEELLARYDISAKAGQLIVARSFEYTTQEDTDTPELNPFARRFAIYHEVGIEIQELTRRGLKLVRVSAALEGESHAFNSDLNLNAIQMATLEASFQSFREAKSKVLPFLTKSYTKIDPAGD